ncbi:DUF3099 family protein [Motilibacter rhizosphaerae]|uniref:DUF3099 family protein n=1 Tax=Motilibacter rhizosphaerae TaxID=598652 RepID=A0A4Q7NG67_9ACTN|nr:DUF3099 domain-containing protein [Motilibacter rhizosphaerae]RZS82774.1 DUF3099 family protein [Motilibacter rhizosphaerae]
MPAAQFRPDSRQAYEITGLARSRAEDIAARRRRYTFGMALRTICFVSAIVTTGWVRWTFVVGAIVLPYIAVVIANAGREPNRTLPPVAMPERRALPAPPSAQLPPQADHAAQR